MFVPKAALSSAASLRNPRRRQRTGSDESVKPPNAKRQRSSLRQGSHEPSLENDTERHALHGASEHATSIASNKLDSAATEDSTTHRNIPIRVLKKSEKKDDEIDGTVVLSKTDFYTVSQLPALPDQIRSLQSEPFRCFFGTSHSYALALTHSHAIIWPYTITASSPSPSDVFTLPIPEVCREPNGTVPLGALLSTANVGIPALIVIMPYTGRIVYWESVSSAATLGLPRQKQTGTQGCISNLLYGEHVTDIVNCEPTGVIVTFSSGRVAHIMLRDPQGKPTVTVNFLRNSSSSGKVGFLGGIKNVLGGGFWRKDLAAVRAGESHQRGQRDVIIATSTGLVEIWDTHWNNGSMLKKQFDVKDGLCNFLGSQYLDDSGNCDLNILDFALTTTKHDTNGLQFDTPESWQLTLVIAPSQSNRNNISLVQTRLSEGVDVISATTIDLYNIPAGLNNSKPKLLVPEPCDTAFIIMGQSIILSSLAPFKDSPASHPSASNAVSQQFHDVINLRSGKDYEILGSGSEDQCEGSSPACLAMVRDFGVIRVTTLPRQDTKNQSKDARVSAKTKIEQAVFYGTMMENPLNLSDKSGLSFPANEIEQAALEICKELLQSTSKFIPTTAISLDQNLRSRAKALDDLAHLLMEQNKVFNRETWWELLWSAEKLAAQRAMWKIEESARRSKAKGPTFLGYVIGLMSEKFKTKLDRQDDGIDPVRSWFLHDTFRMEHIVPWILNAIKPQKGHSSRQGRRISEQILEASELALAVLETAFRYRDEHANQYGIGDGYLEDGVLVTGYKGLPEFWTSKTISFVETGHLLDLELDSCRAWIQKTSTVEVPENQVLRKIAKNSARQLRVLGLMHSERVRWLSAQDDPKLVDESITTEQGHIKQRKWQLFKLAGIGQLEDAITMAEEFRDMGALVELIIELQDQTKGEKHPRGLLEDASDSFDIKSEHLSKKISLYFEKFGESWANAFFSRQISMGQSGILFAMRKFQPFITQFLHNDPTYSRLSWVNDVLGENDYDTAARSLENLAIQHESDIWSHRVELSLAKLAKLATWEESLSPNHSALHNDIRRLEDLAETDAVQEVVYAYIAPILQGAIDQKAEVDLAIDHFGKPIAGDRPSLHEILGEALTVLISRRVVTVDQLVDLLTLIDSDHASESGQGEFMGKEFYLALRVVRLCSFAQRDPSYSIALQKLVWRRCMIKDNWMATGKAAEKVDNDFESFLYDTALFRTLNLCLGDKQSEDANYPSLYIPTSPHDVVLSEPDSGLLASRFRPEQRARIGHDLGVENNFLLQYIDKGKLEFWFNNFVTSAENAGSSTNADATEQPSYSKQAEGPLPQSTDAANTKARLSWL